MLEIVAAKVTVYRCPYCQRKHYHSRKPTEAHAQHCYHNPERVPWLGELWPGQWASNVEAWWAPTDGRPSVWDGAKWLPVRMDEDGKWPLVVDDDCGDWRYNDCKNPQARLHPTVLAQVLLKEGAD